MSDFSLRPPHLDTSVFRIGPVPVGGASPTVLLAGPCVIESEEHLLKMAEGVRAAAEEAGFPLVFKASFDKANRTSASSYRGPGLDAGLRLLARVKEETGLPVVTDVHTEEQAGPAAEVCDLLQIPAFLCRQTDFVQAVGRTGKPVNVKKGQFLAPGDVANIVAKLDEVGAEAVLLTERGVTFGYGNLVTDFRGLAVMARETGKPICFDATHSVQEPGGRGTASGGRREHVPLLCRAACAVGVNALFLETHDDPDRALSDGPNMVPLSDLRRLLLSLRPILDAVNSGVAEG